jgi:hypothetical protein
MFKFLFNFVVSTKFWDWFLSHPMAHFKLRLLDYPKFPMSKYHEIVKILEEQPGFYVFVGSDMSSFSMKVNHLASGAEWAHAGLILPFKKGEPVRILHSIVTGVCTWDLLDYLREVDNFALIRVNVMPEHEQDAKLAVEDAVVKYSGLPYDNDFNLGDKKSLYCSELVYSVFEGFVDSPCFDPSMIAEMPFFTPDDVSRCGDVTLLQKCVSFSKHSKSSNSSICPA